MFFIEYGKASPTDLLIQFRIVNGGPDSAPLTLLRTLWLRNTWSWALSGMSEFADRIAGRSTADPRTFPVLVPEPGVECDQVGQWLFTDRLGRIINVSMDRPIQPSIRRTVFIVI
jgi:hypothetical protein